MNYGQNSDGISVTGTQRENLRKQFGTKDTPSVPIPGITDERLREATRVAREALKEAAKSGRLARALRNGWKEWSALENESIYKGIAFAFGPKPEEIEAELAKGNHAFPYLWAKQFTSEEIAYIWKEVRKRRRGLKSRKFDFHKLSVKNRVYSEPDPDVVKKQIAWSSKMKNWRFRTPKSVFVEGLGIASAEYERLIRSGGSPKRRAARLAIERTMPKISSRILGGEYNTIKMAISRELGRRGGVTAAAMKNVAMQQGDLF